MARVVKGFHALLLARPRLGWQSTRPQGNSLAFRLGLGLVLGLKLGQGLTVGLGLCLGLGPGLG